MSGIRRALVLATAERYVILVVNVVTLAIVSRLLTPAEIGVSVVGIAVMTLVLVVREFATTNFIIQHTNLKLEDIRSTFTVLLLVSLAISTLVFISAGALAAIYSEPNLKLYLRIIALGNLLEIFGAVVSALLRREMAFGKLAIINVAGAAASAIVTIALAFVGFSYMSFAWGLFASSAVVSCLSIVIWRDRSIFRPCLNAWRGMATFGWYNGINVGLYQLYESIPYLVFGRILSFDALALYSRAFSICQMPDKVLLRAVDTVLLPVFSSEARSGRSLRSSYLRSIELITAVQWPALVLLAILAEPIVLLLLGGQWINAVPLVRMMSLAWLFTFSAQLNYPVLVAVGAMQDVLKRSLIAWPISAVIITCAAFFGIEAAALSWFVAVPFQAYVSVYFVRRHVEVRWREIGRALQKSAIVALCSAAGPLSVVFLTGGGFDLTYLASAIATILCALGWGGGLWLTGHPLLREIERAASVIVSNLSPSTRAARVSDRA